MRTRFVSTLPAILLAVIAVVLAVIGLARYDGNQGSGPAPEPQQPARAEAPEGPRHIYLFANDDIFPGTELAPELFREVETFAELPGALGPDDEVPFGQILNVVIRAGSPLTEDAVASITPLQRAVGEGIRAMAFDLDPLSSVGGLLHPGDLVDIIATFRTDPRDIASSVPLISDVEVLAVRGMLDPVETSNEDKEKEEARRRNATMVLAIPETEVSRVALAAEEARLRFVATARGVSVSSLAPQEDVAPEPGEKPAEPEAQPPEPKPVFLADIRPLSPEAKARKAREAAQKQQKKKEDKGLKIQVFEGSEARTVYVR